MHNGEERPQSSVEIANVELCRIGSSCGVDQISRLLSGQAATLFIVGFGVYMRYEL